MEAQVFHNVWYMSKPRPRYFEKLLAYDDVGTLTVTDDALYYQGRDWNFSITNITGLTFGYYGIDYVSKWLCVEYLDAGRPFTVWFKDGGALGWSGIFGGSKAIAEAVYRHVVDPNLSTSLLVARDPEGRPLVTMLGVSKRAGAARALFIGVIVVGILVLLGLCAMIGVFLMLGLRG